MWRLQVLLVLCCAVRAFHCSGLLDEALMAETFDEAVKLRQQMHHPHHHADKNHPHHHNKHAEHRKGAGETVCSCNHNSCVTSNYMCKTRLDAGCFFVKNQSVTSYGCADQLSELDRLSCKIQTTLPKTRGHVELMCCQQDMCNYEIIKNSILDSGLPENLGDQNQSYYDEFWMKVALIAVPLCGGVILVLLVVLACKILQRDSKYDAHLRSPSGYMQCHGGVGDGQNRHSKARLLLLEDGSPTSEKHQMKNNIYKGPQDPKVITWVIASNQGDKPSPV